MFRNINTEKRDDEIMNAQKVLLGCLKTNVEWAKCRNELAPNWKVLKSIISKHKRDSKDIFWYVTIGTTRVLLFDISTIFRHYIFWHFVVSKCLLLYSHSVVQIFSMFFYYDIFSSLRFVFSTFLLFFIRLFGIISCDISFFCILNFKFLVFWCLNFY